MARAIGRTGALALAVVALALAGACDGQFAFDQHGPDASGPCASDSDCPLSTLHCDLTSGQCVPCVDDTSCTSAGYPRCDIALHICVECGSSQDCSIQGWLCSESHRCTQPCVIPDQCPSSAPYCAELVCSACGDNAPCPAGVCDHESGRCVECKSDSDCPGRYCQRALGTCVDCILSSQCPTGTPVCDPTSWTCVN